MHVNGIIFIKKLMGQMSGALVNHLSCETTNRWFQTPGLAGSYGPCVTGLTLWQPGKTLYLPDVKKKM